MSLVERDVMPLSGMLTVPDDAKTLRLVNGSRVGGSFTAFTVRIKLLLTAMLPSFEKMVMRVVPNSFGRGVRMTLRLVPPPLNAMFVFATRFWFEEMPVRAIFNEEVSTSVTVNGTAIGVSSSVPWSPGLESIGKRFVALTVTLNLRDVR